jgi:hypothetical protein
VVYRNGLMSLLVVDRNGSAPFLVVYQNGSGPFGIGPPERFGGGGLSENRSVSLRM